MEQATGFASPPATAAVSQAHQEALAGARTYVLVACTAAASLGLELIQTRILSFLYYNHVVYLTVTIALLGIGISGVFVSLFGSRSANPERTISLLAAGFVISSFACLGAVSRLPEEFPNMSTTPKLVLSYLALTLPFLFSGGVLGWVFMLRAKSIGRLYATDLACSSGAVMAFLLLLWPIGGDWFVWACAGIACIGFLVFSDKVLRNQRWQVAALLVVCCLFWNDHLIGNKPETYKALARAYQPGVTTAKVETTQWTPIARIDLWSDSALDLVSRTPIPDAADSKMITQDADAFTILWGPRHVSWMLDQGARGNLTSALSLTYLLNPKPNDSLVIGVGGGVDVVTAKAYGAKHINAVEINQATVSLDKGPYRRFLGWPTWPEVNLVRGEGRNYVRSKPNHYDTFVMSAVDTFSALNSGAYVLSENYLYTANAMQDYLGSLKPDGTGSIYRWFFYKGPRESLRLAGMLREAGERMGIAHPEQCIMVISDDIGWVGYRWAVTMFKRRPFTPAEVQLVRSTIASHPNLSIVYMPKVFPPDVQSNMERQEADRDAALGFARTAYNRLLNSTAPQRAAFIDSYQFRVDPVFDDKPFFFQYFKPGAEPMNVSALSEDMKTNMHGPAGYWVPYILLAVCGVMSVACILVPLWMFQRRGLKIAGAAPLVLFFACLGAGYMMFEVGAMQVLNVFIGDPAYSLALVLAGLLVASGIGAGISGRLSNRPAVRVISSTTVIIASAIIVWLTWTHVAHPGMMQVPLVARAAITLVGLLPVGILLGVPFPTAVKEVEKLNPNFIAWAWGVNGVTSVLASILAIVVAMQVGFTAVVCIAAAIYLLAMVAYRSHARAVLS